MDIKIGSRTWGPDATEIKAQHEAAKYPGTKIPLGFSVLGIIANPINLANNGNDKPKRYDKTFGKELKTEDVHRFVEIYFDVGNSGKIKDLAQVVISRLESILDIYTRQRKYLTYAASTLFVYDAELVRQYLDSGDKKVLERAVNIRLIDFAHVFPNEAKVEDENFTRGLRNLIKVISDAMLWLMIQLNTQQVEDYFSLVTLNEKKNVSQNRRMFVLWSPC